MSETERMKAERAARIALEEERIKAEKEGVTGGGSYHSQRLFLLLVLQIFDFLVARVDEMSLYCR